MTGSCESRVTKWDGNFGITTTIEKVFKPLTEQLKDLRHLTINELMEAKTDTRSDWMKFVPLCRKV